MDNPTPIDRSAELSRLEFNPAPESASTLKMRQSAVEIAQSGFAAAVIEGEAGAGKRYTAAWIHRHSRRADQPLSVVDATERGATARIESLSRRLPGNVVVASLHRAEVPTVQALLGLLAGQGVQLQCGLLLLTCRPVAELRGRSLPHEQLLGRAATTVLRVPALRTRRADIAPLAAELVREAAARYDRPIRGLSPSALARLERHDFPGNVRELAAVIETAVLRTTGDYVTVDSLGGLPPSDEPSGSRAEIVIRMPGSSLREIELQALRSALQLAGGRVVRAADLLGITRHALRRKLEKYDLNGLRQRPGHRVPVFDDDACI